MGIDYGGNRVKDIVVDGAGNSVVTVYIDGGFEHLYKLSSSSVVSEAQNELHVIPLREDTVDGRSRVARVKVEVGIADEVKYNLEEEEARNTQLPKGMLLSPWMKLVL
jgi:hypothetical protein